MSQQTLLDFPLLDVEDGPPAQAFGFDVQVAPGPHRRRHHEQPHMAAVIQQPPPPPPQVQGKSRIGKWIDGTKTAAKNMKKSIELRQLDFWTKWEPTLDKWWKRRFIIRRVFCMALAGIIGIAWYMTSLSDPASYVVEASNPTWARSGQEGVDFAATSTEITCAELESGSLARVVSTAEEPSIVRLRSYAGHVLGHESLPCVCAPMFGTRRRYMAVLADKDHVRHLYNPVIDTTWNAKLPDGSPAMPGKSVVSQHQRMLFPGKTGTVDHVRANAIRLTYRDEACASSAIILQQSAAWCAQTCLDLMDGRSVYSTND